MILVRTSASPAMLTSPMVSEVMLQMFIPEEP